MPRLLLALRRCLFRLLPVTAAATAGPLCSWHLRLILDVTLNRRQAGQPLTQALQRLLSLHVILIHYTWWSRRFEGWLHSVCTGERTHVEAIGLDMLALQV